MKTTWMDRKIKADHGEICSMPDDLFGYFGWGSVGRLGDGTLLAGISGMRTAHVCPYGRTTIFVSRDDGSTWSGPRVITDTPLDDRDVGVTPLGGQSVLVSWFISDHRDRWSKLEDPEQKALWEPGLKWVTDENAARFAGSWVRSSDDGGDTWNEPVRVPVTAPHGPVRLRDGSLLYLGKQFGTMKEHEGHVGGILAVESADGGKTWSELGEVPPYKNTSETDYHEPHVTELSSGKLIGVIRFHGAQALGHDFAVCTMQTESSDGGKTWTEAQPMDFHSVPPQIIQHSSGVLIMSYGCREEPCGQRVGLSADEGQTWDYGYILRDDGPNTDLGYPCSVELADGSIFTVYYQKAVTRWDKCGFFWSRWRLP